MTSSDRPTSPAARVARGPAGRAAQTAAGAAVSPAKMTGRTARYVTRPTRLTLFLRTFLPWQLWRFARINLKMIRIIHRSRT